jgi:hypothetical protein
MPALTRRCDLDRADCWLIHYGDVCVGAISRGVVECLLDDVRYCRLDAETATAGSRYHVSKPSSARLAHAVAHRTAKHP